MQMTTRSGIGAITVLSGMAVAGLFLQACGDDTNGRAPGHDGAVVPDAPGGMDQVAPADIAFQVPDAPGGKDVAVDVAFQVPDAPGTQDQTAIVDVAIPAPDAPGGQDQVTPVDVAFSVETSTPIDGPPTVTEAGTSLDTAAAIATTTEFVDQLRLVVCADIDRCCGANATVVKGHQGGCNASDWAPVVTTLQASVDTGAMWDGVSAAGCIAGLTQKLAGSCDGPPLGNRTLAEAIVNIRSSSIAACKTFINAGEKGIGDECGSHLECKAGLQCVTDLAPSVCAPLRDVGDNCGGDVLCNFDGLYCDDANTGTCLALAANGASCTSGIQCSDGMCDGLPKVCTAVCR
jgi:hypothetical protein